MDLFNKLPSLRLSLYEPGRLWIECIEPFGRQIADAQSEPIAENGAYGKDVIGKAVRVGELFADMAADIGHKQAIEYVRTSRASRHGAT